MQSRVGGRAPVSVTFIVRDREEALARAVASVRPHVAEIVIVDTGSVDGTPDVAKRLADRFKQFDGCNNPDTGLIEDFSSARNFALSLAREPWAMWMDSDDELTGGQALAPMLASLARQTRPIQISFPYRDDNLTWTRERIVSLPKDFEWVDPCHEILRYRPPSDKRRAAAVHSVSTESLTMVHHKDRDQKRERGRNLRILRAALNRQGYLTPRQMFYIGREHADLGNVPEAITWLLRCTQSSGWEDECAMAHMQLADLYIARLDFDRALQHALLAHDTCETWGEPLVKIAAVHYQLANRSLDRHNEWRHHVRRCEHFTARAVAAGPARTALFVNRHIMRGELQRYRAHALHNLGRTPEAIECIDNVLSEPISSFYDVMLRAHRRFYAKEPEPTEPTEAAAGDDSGSREAVERVEPEGTNAT